MAGWRRLKGWRRLVLAKPVGWGVQRKKQEEPDKQSTLVVASEPCSQCGWQRSKEG